MQRPHCWNSSRRRWAKDRAACNVPYPVIRVSLSDWVWQEQLLMPPQALSWIRQVPEEMVHKVSKEREGERDSIQIIILNSFAAITRKEVQHQTWWRTTFVKKQPDVAQLCETQTNKQWNSAGVSCKRFPYLAGWNRRETVEYPYGSQRNDILIICVVYAIYSL